MIMLSDPLFRFTLIYYKLVWFSVLISVVSYLHVFKFFKYNIIQELITIVTRYDFSSMNAAGLDVTIEFTFQSMIARKYLFYTDK